MNRQDVVLWLKTAAIISIPTFLILLLVGLCFQAANKTATVPANYREEWDGGVNAAKAGISTTANPYVGTLPRSAAAWLNGYMSVKQKELKPE